MIRIQQQDFSMSDEYQSLRDRAGSECGAIATFTGLVRDFGDQNGVTAITLEHYEGMTQKCLQSIVDQARSRWALIEVSVIHRVGRLALGDQIVYVGVASAHRKDAFEACQFIMDYLKSEAPIWKKECSESSERWVEAKDSDRKSAQRWAQKKH